LLTRKTLKLSTVHRKVKCLRSLIKRNIDVNNPEAVIKFINTCGLASGTKEILVDAYRDYLDMLGLANIKLPHIRREDTLPFIPLEREIDVLISSTRRKLSTFLLLLKETGVRPIEAWRVKWDDIDVPHRTVTVKPAKYSRARKLKISEQLLNMLLALPKTNAYVFSPSGNPDRFHIELEHFSRNYTKQRKRIANKLKNPRLMRISLRTFRHWKATMEYIKTRDIVHIKEMLGHVNINNTLKYIHLANAITNNENQYICKTAKTVEEARKLIEQGFEYVCEMEGVKIFRKRK
jgi:integrase